MTTQSHKWEDLFRSWLTIEMWTSDYYKLLEIIGDDYI